MKVLKKFKKYTEEKGLYFENNDSVKSYREDTLFCIAGMQKYIDVFSENTKSIYDIVTNNQAVLRCSDINEIHDKTHYLYFNMLGYFDFNKKDYISCIKFWMEFCFSKKYLGLPLNYIEIHPDVKSQYRILFENIKKEYKIDIVENSGLTWSDGNINGYSTEFYVDGVEIGNIVLLKNGMIDCGFGLERLESMYNKKYEKPEEMEILFMTATKIIECGYVPKSNGKQEYILWDILKRLIPWEDRQQLAYDRNPTAKAFRFVRDKYKANQNKYAKLKDKFPGKDKQWWLETHGIYL